MIKTAICDDEANTRAYLTALIRAQPFSCEVTEYASAEECLADQRELDLYLLDIELRTPDGSVASVRREAEKYMGELELHVEQQEFSAAVLLQERSSL